jgi:hypothetical protein
MYPLEIWGLGGPLGSTRAPYLSQSAENNLADRSTLDIDVFGSKPPEYNVRLIGPDPTRRDTSHCGDKT